MFLLCKFNEKYCCSFSLVYILFNVDESFKDAPPLPPREMHLPRCAEEHSAFLRVPENLFRSRFTRIAERNYQLNHIVECPL